MTNTNKRTFIVSEQIFITHEVEATSEAEAHEMYDAYLATEGGKLELIETALQNAWDSRINIEEQK